jgi:hypothetical protein
MLNDTCMLQHCAYQSYHCLGVLRADGEIVEYVCYDKAITCQLHTQELCADSDQHRSPPDVHTLTQLL